MRWIAYITSSYDCLFSSAFEPKSFDILPTAVRVANLTPFSARLRWTNSPYNCDVVAHHIVQVGGSLNATRYNVYDVETTEFIAEGLMANREYFFSVSALLYPGTEVVYNGAVSVTTLAIPGKFCFVFIDKAYAMF